MDFVDAKVDKEEAKTTGNCFQVSTLYNLPLAFNKNWDLCTLNVDILTYYL